jgi:low temperature requirement protein LtrA
MWWIYFSYSAERNAHAVEDAWDSGRAARIVYVYLHIPLICGLLLSAAGDEALVKHPADAATLGNVAQLVGGTTLFLVGALVVKRVICGQFMSSHVTGLLMLILLSPLAIGMPLYQVGLGVAAILVAVAVWEEVAIRLARRRRGLDENAGAEEKISMVEV